MTAALSFSIRYSRSCGNPYCISLRFALFPIRYFTFTVFTRLWTAKSRLPARASPRLVRLSELSTAQIFAESTLMASGVMPPVGDVACIPSEASKQLSEQPCKRAKHSALDKVTQLFQQVLLTVRATLQRLPLSVPSSVLRRW